MEAADEGLDEGHGPFRMVAPELLTDSFSYDRVHLQLLNEEVAGAHEQPVT
jgi:hypothetical protein